MEAFKGNTLCALADNYGDHNCVLACGTTGRGGLVPVSAKYRQGSHRTPSESFTWSALLSHCWFIITLHYGTKKRYVKIQSYIVVGHTCKRHLSDVSKLAICSSLMSE
jgi:hypothetical protein